MEVTEGFVIQVDPASLRLAAGRADLVADDLAAAATEARAAAAEASWHLQTCGLGGRIAELHDGVRGTAARLRYCADVYEAAEASWTLDAYGRGSPLGAAAESALDLLSARYAGSDLDPLADGRRLLAERRAHAVDGVAENLAALPDVRWVLPLLGSPPATTAAAVLPSAPVAATAAYRGLVARGLGTVPRGRELGGDPNGQRISVTVEKPRPSGGGAPAGMADAARRIPQGPDDLVRVETYRFADGHAEHAVYVQGTREMTQDGDWRVLPLPEAGRDASDMESNADTYLGDQKSEAHRGVERAIMRALEQVDAHPQDALHLFGHSQGGMIVERLASEGDLNVETVVSFASPQQAHLDDSVLHVNLAYTDDPVAGLVGEGVPGSAGAPGSAVITDTFDPGADAFAPLEPHRLEHYVALAAEADASADRRLDAIDGVFGHLAEAQSVEVATGNVTRVSRNGAPVSGSSSPGDAG